MRVGFKPIIIPLLLALLTMPILSTTMFSQVSAQNYKTGTVFETKYLRVGVNNYGVLGIMDSNLGAVGLQYPKGSQYESIAVGQWVDRYNLYIDGFYLPNNGFNYIEVMFDPEWGLQTWSINGEAYIEFVDIYTRLLDNVLMKRISLVILDSYSIPVCQLNHTFYMFKEEKYVIYKLTIKMLIDPTLIQIYKYVDYDVWGNYYGPDENGKYNNWWGVDDVRRPDLNLIVAHMKGLGEVYYGFSKYPTTTGIAPTSYEKKLYSSLQDPSIHFHPRTPYLISIDGSFNHYNDDWILYRVEYNEYIYNENIVGVGDIITHVFVYAVGDSLDELESNVEEAFNVIENGYGKKVNVIEASGISRVMDPFTGVKMGVASLRLDLENMDGKLCIKPLILKGIKHEYYLRITSVSRHGNLIIITGTIMIDKEYMFKSILNTDDSKITFTSLRSTFIGKAKITVEKSFVAIDP